MNARCLLVVSCLLAHAAVAQAPAAKKEAAARYNRGVSLYKEGDFAGALTEFKAAYNAVPTPDVLFNIALTERRLRKYALAVRDLNRYVAESDKGGKGVKPLTQERREAVEKELTEIRETTATVTIQVEGTSASISVDGEDVGSSPLKEPLLLAPGQHTFRAERGKEVDEESLQLYSGVTKTIALSPKGKESTALVVVSITSQPTGALLTVDGKLAGTTPTKVELPPGKHEVAAENDGFASLQETFVVIAGQEKTLALKLVPGKGGAQGDANEGDGSEPNVSASSAGRKARFPVLGTILGVAGVGAIVGSVVLMGSAQAASKRVSDLFAMGGTWTAEYAQLDASGRTSQTASIALAVSGGVLLAGGVVATILTLVSSSEEPAEGQGDDSSPASTFWLSPDGHGGVAAGWNVRF